MFLIVHCVLKSKFKIIAITIINQRIYYYYQLKSIFERRGRILFWFNKVLIVIYSCIVVRKYVIN